MLDQLQEQNLPGTGPHSGVGSYEVREAPVVIPDPDGGEGTPATVPYVAFQPAVVVTAGPAEIAAAEGRDLEGTGSGVVSATALSASRPDQNADCIPPEDLFKAVTEGNGVDIYVRQRGVVLKYRVVIDELPDEGITFGAVENNGTLDEIGYANYDDHPTSMG